MQKCSDIMGLCRRKFKNRLKMNYFPVNSLFFSELRHETSLHMTEHSTKYA